MPILRLAALCSALFAPTLARAETPVLLSIEVGSDQMEVAAPQITMVEVRTDQRGPVVYVQLDPSLQSQLSDLTASHVGQVLTLRVCGVEVEEGMLNERLTKAAIAITAISPATAHHLAAVLKSKDCRNAPSS